MIHKFYAVASLASLLVMTACGGGDAPCVVRTAACVHPVGTSTVVVGSGLPGDLAIPELASGYKLGKKVLTSASDRVVTANPLAKQAGCDVLAAGGSAVDAGVAVQVVSGLVEPQSSGLGGGAFMLRYNASTKALQSFDGREIAPAAATEDYLRFVSSINQTNPLPNLGNDAAGSFLSTKASGRSIGRPGALRMLGLAHQDNGKTAWSALMQPGIKLANDSFPISGRTASAIAGARTDLLRDPEAAAHFLILTTQPKRWVP